MKDLISVLEELREYYLVPIIKKTAIGQERIKALTRIIEILKRIDERQIADALNDTVMHEYDEPYWAYASHLVEFLKGKK